MSAPGPRGAPDHWRLDRSSRSRVNILRHADPLRPAAASRPSCGRPTGAPGSSPGRPGGAPGRGRGGPPPDGRQRGRRLGQDDAGGRLARRPRAPDGAWVALDDWPTTTRPASGATWPRPSRRAGVPVDAQAVGRPGRGPTRRARWASSSSSTRSPTAASARCSPSTTCTRSTDAEITDSLAFLVPRLPGRLRVVVTTRTDPPIGLARLRARGDLGELRAGDLRFSGDEAGRTAGRRHRRRPGPRRRRAPARRAPRAGPPASTWRACRCAAREDAGAFIADFAGDDRLVVDYLAAEVLEGQPRRAARLPAAHVDPAAPDRGPLRRRGRRQGSAAVLPSSSARTCSWCRSTAAGSGTATTTSSASCCATSWRWRRARGGSGAAPRASSWFWPRATSTRRSTTPRRRATWTAPPT